MLGILGAKKRSSKKWMNRLTILSLILTVIAVCLNFIKLFGLSRDYTAYESFFNLALTGACEDLSQYATLERYSPVFKILTCNLSKLVTSSEGIYGVMLGVSLLPKLLILAKIHTAQHVTSWGSLVSFLLGVLLYFCRFFPLHELTQIRTSLAISFFMIGAFLISSSREKSEFHDDRKKNILSRYCLSLPISGIGILLHSSLIIGLPFVIAAKEIQNRKQNLLFSFSFFIGLVYLIPFLIPWLEVVDFSGISIYGNHNVGKLTNTFLSPSKIIDIGLICSAFVCMDKNDKFQTYFLNLSLYSLVLFYALASSEISEAIIFRLSEVIQVFIVCLVVSFRKKKQIWILCPWVLLSAARSLLSFMKDDFFL
jgi:hypothetical protein